MKTVPDKNYGNIFVVPCFYGDVDSIFVVQCLQGDVGVVFVCPMIAWR